MGRYEMFHLNFTVKISLPSFHNYGCIQNESGLAVSGYYKSPAIRISEHVKTMGLEKILRKLAFPGKSAPE